MQASGVSENHGVLGWFKKNRGITVDVKVVMLERIVVCTLCSVSESLVLNARKRRILGMYDMKFLRKVIEVGMMGMI